MLIVPIAAVTAATLAIADQACDGEQESKLMSTTKTCGWGATEQEARDAAYFNVPNMPDCAACDEPATVCNTDVGFADAFGNNVTGFEFLRPAPGGGFNCCYIYPSGTYWVQICSCDE
jgi:hypothetical protein